MTKINIDLPDGRAIAIDDGRFPLVLHAADSNAGDVPRRTCRLVYAAAHLAMRESYGAATDRQSHPAGAHVVGEHIDWEATQAIRCHLAAYGFGIAEGMDTAQRFEIGWPVAEELIKRTSALDLPQGFVAGAGTDHHPRLNSKSQLVDAIAFQIRWIQDLGGIPVVLPSVWLAQHNQGAEDYVEVYSDVIRISKGPIFLHWLGEMFLPAMRGYFPGDSFERIMSFDAEKVAGAKLSLLDPAREADIRRRFVERRQILLTGDDWNFASLVGGEDQTPICHRRLCDTDVPIGAFDVPIGAFSHGLLGIFDAIAVPFRVALLKLAEGDVASYLEIASPCEALSRIVFEVPTQDYKSGLAFLSWLNGQQSNRMLPHRAELARSREHLTRVAAAAAAAGAFTNAPLAAERLRAWFGEAGGR